MILQKNDVSVRPFTKDDIENKIKWINDPLNNAYLHYDIPLVYDKTLEWFNRKNNDTRFDGVIEYGGVAVGLIGLLSIDKSNGKAEFYISMGEDSYKRKGIASQATMLILDYAFYELNLHKVYLNVDEDNVAACRLYEKVGFVCEGVFVDDMIHRGKFINRKRYALISTDYKKGAGV